MDAVSHSGSVRFVRDTPTNAPSSLDLSPVSSDVPSRGSISWGGAHSAAAGLMSQHPLDAILGGLGASAITPFEVHPSIDAAPRAGSRSRLPEMRLSAHLVARETCELPEMC